jgi:hypothetical protein
MLAPSAVIGIFDSRMDGISGDSRPILVEFVLENLESLLEWPFCTVCTVIFLALVSTAMARP